MIAGVLFSVFATALAAPSLEELRKLDFSILSGHKGGRERPSERCFLRPEVNRALSRVQQRLQVLQLGLRVEKCYVPSDAVFGKGAAVKLVLSKPAKEAKDAKRQLLAALRAEGFKSKGKGTYRHEIWKEAPMESTPVDALP